MMADHRKLTRNIQDYIHVRRHTNEQKSECKSRNTPTHQPRRTNTSKQGVSTSPADGASNGDSPLRDKGRVDTGNTPTAVWNGEEKAELKPRKYTRRQCIENNNND
jgi:hypothetical protein